MTRAKILHLSLNSYSKLKFLTLTLYIYQQFYTCSNMQNVCFFGRILYIMCITTDITYIYIDIFRTKRKQTQFGWHLQASIFLPVYPTVGAEPTLHVSRSPTVPLAGMVCCRRNNKQNRSYSIKYATLV